MRLSTFGHPLSMPWNAAFPSAEAPKISATGIFIVYVEILRRIKSVRDSRGRCIVRVLPGRHEITGFSGDVRDERTEC